MPEISVIVPIYKVEKYLCQCIDSILAQTYTDFELILVDDGSPDNCGNICDEYAEHDMRVKVIHQMNQGQATARNYAVRRAEGNWICFVDADDIIHPQMLELLHNAASIPGVQISMCSAEESEAVPEAFFEQKKYAVSVFDVKEDALVQLYDTGEHRCWVVWAKLIRKEIIENILFTEGRIYEDNAVVCRWLYEARKVADIRERLYFYRINGEGTTKSQFNVKKLDYLWALEEKLKFYSMLNFDKLRTRFCNLYLQTAADYRQKARVFASPDLLSQISKNMRRIYWKNKNYITFTKRQGVYIYAAMYPKRMQLYWIVQAAKRVIKEEGLQGLLKKITKRLCGGNKK